MHAAFWLQWLHRSGYITYSHRYYNNKNIGFGKTYAGYNFSGVELTKVRRWPSWPISTFDSSSIHDHQSLITDFVQRNGKGAVVGTRRGFQELPEWLQYPRIYSLSLKLSPIGAHRADDISPVQCQNLVIDHRGDFEPRCRRRVNTISSNRWSQGLSSNDLLEICKHRRGVDEWM